MKKKISLPILSMNEYTEGKEAAGLDYDIAENDIITANFYNIDAIYSHRDNRYTTICVGGDTFVCTLKLADVEKLIDKYL